MSVTRTDEASGDISRNTPATDEEPHVRSNKQLGLRSGGYLDDGTIRINAWASPRSLSTALMYSFAQRPDTVVHDEPLYAHFLRTHPEEETWRPYRELVFKEQDSDGDRWVREVALGPTPRPVVYMKHMSKQLRNLDRSFVPKCRNIIQIRNPMAMLPSWNHNLTPTIKEVGILDTLDIYSLITSIGQRPIILDAEVLRMNPEGVLRELTEMLGIPYRSEQLSWPAGPKPYDGCWGYLCGGPDIMQDGDSILRILWLTCPCQSILDGYKGCRASTYFDDSPRYAVFDRSLTPLMEECMPIYQMLRAKAITGYGRLGKVPRPLPSSCPDRDEIALGAALRNEDALVWVGDGLVPRDMAKVSVMDSSISGGDAVRECIRVCENRIVMLDRHLECLVKSAEALRFEGIPSTENVKVAIFSALAANDMRDGVHVHVTLTRGTKTTCRMNPNFNVFGCTLIVVPERRHDGVAEACHDEPPVALVTVSASEAERQSIKASGLHDDLADSPPTRMAPSVQVAEKAVMLDAEGFIVKADSAAVFVVKDGAMAVSPMVATCISNVMRDVVKEIAADLGIPCEEHKLSATELYGADEVLLGTMGELTPVLVIDGQAIGGGQPGPLTGKLHEALLAMISRSEVATPLPEFRR